ncbi:MAG: hypothetical protein JNN03_22505 [Rubrivivax sp.]|nr:hypothetical protein [Rubrivivax sp.]
MHARRLALLRRLEKQPLATAEQVQRLHEMLCYLRAYPGRADVLEQVERMLEGFAFRDDLRRHRRRLDDTGIVGTAIHYRFFSGQAQWLAARWPAHLHLDRSDEEAGARIGAALPPLLAQAEADALMELKPGGYAALDLLRGSATDATFLLQRIAALPTTSLAREALSDAIDASHVLWPGPGTPSRTEAFFGAAPMARVLEAAPVRGRPDPRAELARAPRRVRELPLRAGRELADLAQAAMVTRARSLEAFSYANPADACLVDDGDGLAFGFMGVLPERRHALATLVGGLTLRNRVPIGYVQADIVGRSAALSFNTFDTFRGAEAAYTFARWLAALHHLHGTTAFTIEPYQLGHGNDEGLHSGAWWFYYKLGFRPRSAARRAMAEREAARLARHPGARTPARTLLALAEEHLCFDVDEARPHPIPQPAALGLAAGAALSRLAGADREAAVAACAEALLRQCGLRGWGGFSADERRAWDRLAPVVALFEVGTWPLRERAALATLMRAKGAASERAFVAHTLAHPRFEAALLAAGERRAGLL